jgi:uncharacterized RDD family membrane protein YckC
METESTIPIQEGSNEKYPPLIKRFQSLIIDMVFIIVCMFIISIVLSNFNEDKTGILKGILLVGLFFIYEPFCMAFGCTIGNLISGIRVRKYLDENRHINLFNSYLRFVVKLFLGIISFLTVTTNRQKRAIHDMAAGSIMVFAEKM